MDDLESRKAFLRYYRMPEETFDKLVQLLAPHLEKNAHMARECVCSVLNASPLSIHLKWKSVCRLDFSLNNIRTDSEIHQFINSEFRNDRLRLEWP